jgi:hypothetical protein
MTAPWIAAFVVLVCVVLMLAVVVLGLIARLERLEAHPQATPQVDMHDRVPGGGLQIGESVSMVEFDRRGQPSTVRLNSAVVLFGSHGCGPCEVLREQLTRRPLATPGRDQILVWDGAEEPPAVPGWRTHADRAQALRTLLRVDSTPYCFVTDAHSVVRAAGVPNSVADIEQLLAEATAGTQPSREHE